MKCLRNANCKYTMLEQDWIECEFIWEKSQLELILLVVSIYVIFQDCILSACFVLEFQSGEKKFREYPLPMSPHRLHGYLSPNGR